MTDLHSNSHVPVVSEDELDALQTLHTRITDGLAGFETMVTKAEPTFRPTVEAFLDLHRRHQAAVGRLLVEGGREADDDGSFMGTVNRAVVATRAAFDDIDADVMKPIRSGEQHVLRAFDEAIEHTSDGDRVGRLRKMLEELRRLLDAAPIPA